jgi:hypothetical protein
MSHQRNGSSTALLLPPSRQRFCSIVKTSSTIDVTIVSSRMEPWIRRFIWRHCFSDLLRHKPRFLNTSAILDVNFPFSIFATEEIIFSQKC